MSQILRPLLHVSEGLLCKFVLLLACRRHLFDHVLSGTGILGLDSVHDAASVLEEGVVLDAHRADDVAVVVLVAEEHVALVVRRDAIVVARELLELVPEFVVLPMLAAGHANILALKILQALLPHLVRIEVDLIVSHLDILSCELSIRAVFAVLDDLTL